MPNKPTKPQAALWLTVGELKRQLKALKVPNDASIKYRSMQDQLKFLSFNRETKEISLH